LKLVDKRRLMWRAVQAALAVLIIALAVRTLTRNWVSFRAQEIRWSVSPAWLAGSLAVVWLSYALLVEAWRRVVVAMRQRLAWLAAARICMLANLGKYIPGKVWSVAGAALLAQRAGVAPAAAVAAAVILQALSLASGVVLVALVAPSALAGVGSWLVVATVVLGAAALAGVLALTWAPGVRLIQRLLPRTVPELPVVPLGVMLAAFVANLVAWGAYGLAFQWLARGLTGGGSGGHLTWTAAAAAFTLSYLVGLVAVFAPAGVGPRESVFVLVLQGPLGLKVAVALAVASRILLTITELGAAVPFLITRKGAAG
jgi:glycosyltransferase 2 family protein